NLILWELGSNRRRKLSSQTKTITGVAFSADGQWVAAAWMDGTLGVWEVGTAELKATFKEPAGFFGLAFSAKGDLLACCTGSGRLRIWQIAATGANKTTSK